jgi:hypothetical protein
MADTLTRAAGVTWRVLAAAGVGAVALAAVVAATGGLDWSLGPMRVRAHSAWRLLGVGFGLCGAAVWVGRGRVGAALVRAWVARNTYAAGIAAAAALAVAAAGLLNGTWIAGSADAFGYVSQALLWLQGLPVQTEPLAAAAPWPHAEWSFSPLGYRPGTEPGAIVPTYPPGLPLTMAAFAGVWGAGAVYWVVPLSGAAAVWLTFLLGRRYADGTSGAAAALLLAASPVFLYQLFQPMSDVPVTAWWLLSLWGCAAGMPWVAGSGAAAAMLTRPNLAPLGALVTTAVLAQAYSRHRTSSAVLRAAAAFGLPFTAAVAFLAWLSTRLYGSPVSSGYGAAPELFSLANVTVNAGRYPRWLVETQTPVVLLGLAAPLAAWFVRRRAPHAPSPAQSWLGLAFVALVLSSYLPYSSFEEWWYLRFLLPAIPVLLVLTSSVLVRLVSQIRIAARVPVLAGAVALLGTYYVAVAAERSAFDLRRLESRYLAAGAFASHALPPNAVLLSLQESGSLRMYGGRTTVRFDHIDPKGLEAAVQFFDGSGHRPYFVLEVWEETQFRDRFAGSGGLGLLDWPPMAEVGRPVKVRFYDPRDRQRFLAGEPVATARDPLEDRTRR